MATTQDASVGFVTETTYKTGVTPVRWLRHTDESLDWTKTVVQGSGLQVGARVARSNQRVVPVADGAGDITYQCSAKGFGLMWQACLGTGVSTVVSGATYQQLFTLGDTPPSLTVQKGIPEAGGTVDAYTFLGAMVASWEFAFPNADIATLKPTFDVGDLATATAYATPSYSNAPNLFHFANGTISSGTLTAPTTTALASGATPLANVRSGTLSVNNNIRDDRYNFGGAGRKAKPTVGLREITGSLVVEYDATAYRDLFLADTPMNLIATFTGGALSTGLETLQLVLPELKIDTGGIPMTNGTDLVTQTLNFTGLDNQTAAQPIWVVARTSDTAL
jgi:hypothetical protein